MQVAEALTDFSRRVAEDPGMAPTARELAALGIDDPGMVAVAAVVFVDVWGANNVVAERYQKAALVLAGLAAGLMIARDEARAAA